MLFLEGGALPADDAAMVSAGTCQPAAAARRSQARRRARPAYDAGVRAVHLPAAGHGPTPTHLVHASRA